MIFVVKARVCPRASSRDFWRRYLACWTAGGKLGASTKVPAELDCQGKPRGMHPMTGTSGQINLWLERGVADDAPSNGLARLDCGPSSAKAALAGRQRPALTLAWLQRQPYRPPNYLIPPSPIPIPIATNAWISGHCCSFVILATGQYHTPDRPSRAPRIGYQAPACLASTSPTTTAMRRSTPGVFLSPKPPAQVQRLWDVYMTEVSW